MSNFKEGCTMCGRKGCAITIITDMDHVCEECLDNEFFYCDECNEYWRCDVVDSYELKDGRTVCEHCVEDIDDEEIVDEDKKRIEELIRSISGNDTYSRRVYEADGIYFIIHDGEILEISNDAGYDPKGGWFPDIVSGLSDEEADDLHDFMNDADGDIRLFEELVENNVYDDCAEDYIKEKYDESTLEGYLKVEQAIESGNTPFDSMDELFSAIERYWLDSECLYYKWEGEYIDLYENICDCGEKRGYFDSIDSSKWINILENIDDYTVNAVNE